MPCLMFAVLLVSGSFTALSPPPYTDAEILALEVSGELLPPPDIVETIASDLSAIRAEYPACECIPAMPDWVPGYLSVRLTEAAFEAFLAGQYHGLDALNDTYGPVTITYSNPPWLRLTFSLPYNPEVLAQIYRTGESVMFADPAHLICLYKDDITVLSFERFQHEYRFEMRWDEVHGHTWEFAVGDGVVFLLNEYGDEVAVEESSWGRVKALFAPEMERPTR